MTNWQTTVAGLLLTIGTLLIGSGETGILHFVGMILAGIGGIWLGIVSTDAKKP